MCCVVLCCVVLCCVVMCCVVLCCVVCFYRAWCIRLWALEVTGLDSTTPARTELVHWCACPCPPGTDPLLLVVIGLLLLVGLGSALVLLYLFKRRMQTAQAPKDATQPFLAMFVSLKNENALWAQYEEPMHRVSVAISRMITRTVQKHKCYQV